MAILIVDDETQTREALRSLLTQLSYKIILEAKNGEEALKLIDLEKSRIQIIVADLEMPYLDGLTLAKKVSERPFLDLAPFVLISSDHLPSSTRIDATLIKPFRKSILAKTMKDAFHRRSRLRKQILYIGAQIPSPLSDFLQSPLTPFWKNATLISSAMELRKILEFQSFQFGALVIDPMAFPEKEQIELSKVLGTFKKTPIGTATPLACLSKEPNEIFHFRTLCQFYFNPQFKFQDWQETLLQIETRILNTWEVEILFQNTKNFIQQKDYSSAWKLAQKMIHLDSENYEIQNLAGDLLAHLGQTEKAILAYQRGLNAHPTSPRPYLKLLSLLPRNASKLRLDLAEAGVRYCPHNVDILLRSAQAFNQEGNFSRSRLILETLLKINPNHSSATALLESLPCKP